MISQLLQVKVTKYHIICRFVMLSYHEYAGGEYFSIQGQGQPPKNHFQGQM